MAEAVVITLTPSGIADAMRGLIATRPHRSAFIWGSPGISKSAKAKQVATEQEMAFIDIRLSQCAPEDLRGMPYPTIVGGVRGVKWSAPLELPRDLDYDDIVIVPEAVETRVQFYNPMGKNRIPYCKNPEFKIRSLTEGAVAKIIDGHEDAKHDTVVVALFAVEGGKVTDRMVPGKVHVRIKGKVRAIIALEEFNSAPASVTAASYELIHDRSLGEYLVPEDAYIFAMGNNETDGGITFKMPTPVSNRFVHYNMEVNFPEWQRWALLNEVHPIIVGYLSDFTGKLMQFKSGIQSRAFATPRTWEFASDFMKANPDASESLLVASLAGCVGDADALELNEYCKKLKEMPKCHDILAGTVKKLQKAPDTSLSFAMVTEMCYILKHESDDGLRKFNGNRAQWKATKEADTWMKRADNYLGFMMDNFKDEICVMGCLAAISTHDLPMDNKKMANFAKFTQKYKSAIMGRQVAA